jgi:hypothetical protein
MLPKRISGRLESEAGGGGSFGVEGGDSFDEAGDGEGVADAALAADEVESPALAGERDGELYQRGDAGAVDLGDVVEIDDDFARPALNQVLREVVQMFTGFADGEASVYLKVVDATVFARRNFQRWMKRH